MQEIEIHLKAFEYFFQFGGAPSQKNYERVANSIDVSKRTIERWSLAFKWKSRASERKAQFQSQLKKHTTKSLLTTTDKYRAIIKKAIDRFENNLAADIVSVKTVEQFERLVKLDMSLTGQTYGNAPVTINIISAVPRPGDRKEKISPILDMITENNRVANDTLQLEEKTEEVQDP